jgi:hypothetical protein
MTTSGTGPWSFLKTRKKFWLLPLVVVLVLFALLVIVSSGSEGNFVYTLD